MTGPTGLINFFVLEASDYVEQLDSLLHDAGPAGPEAESFTRAARALRGSATMAKRRGIAALAAAVERLGRALRERILPWTPAMRDSLTASVQDLRHLVRAARDYSADDEERAQARTSELLAFAPPSMRAAAPTPIASGSGTMFVVSGATDVAAALTAAASRPANHELHAEALSRLRGFRGVAALRDHLPLAEALDIVERVARNIDRQEGIPVSSATAVLSTGARHLRRLAEDIRAGRAHDRRNPEASAFIEAVARHETAQSAPTEVVVPIASLFFADDGPRIVRQTAAPVTTATDRFRLESAAAAEHLRRLCGEAHREVRREEGLGDAGPATGRTSALQTAANSLSDLAHSYGYEELGESLTRALANLDPTDALSLAAGDAVGVLLVAQRRRVDDLARRIGDLAAGRSLGSLVALGYAPLDLPRATPVATTAQQAATAPAPSSTATPLSESPVNGSSTEGHEQTAKPTVSSPTVWPEQSTASPTAASVAGSPTEWREQSSAAPAPSPEPEPEFVAQAAPASWSEPELTAVPTPATVSTATPAEVVQDPDPSDIEQAPAAEDDGMAVARRASVDESMAVPPGTDRPTGRDLHALLASSIAVFERMPTPTEFATTSPAGAAATPASASAVTGSTDSIADDQDSDQPVPVEVLLYRGRSALGRALELRDEIRRQGGTPPAEQLDELFDLLDLAATA